LQRLRPDHEQAVLAFEQANRGYFAESITDRGDDFYEQFAERHRALLADQQAGVSAYYVLADEDGEVVGRFNLYDLLDKNAEVGYRVAKRGRRPWCGDFRTARTFAGLRASSIGCKRSEQRPATRTLPLRGCSQRSGSLPPDQPRPAGGQDPGTNSSWHAPDTHLAIALHDTERRRCTPVTRMQVSIADAHR